MGTYCDCIQSTVIGIVSVILTLGYSALNAGICVTSHSLVPPLKLIFVYKYILPVIHKNIKGFCL